MPANTVLNEAQQPILNQVGNLDYKTILESLGNPEQLRLLLNSSKDLYLKIAETRDRYTNKTIFDHALDHPECLGILLDFLPQEKRFKAVTEYIRGVLPVLYYAIVEKPESLKVILKALPEEEHPKVANTVNLYDAAKKGKSESLRILLEALPEDKRLEAITEKCRDNNKTAVLYYGVRSLPLLIEILKTLPEEQRLAIAIEEKDRNGNNALHNAVKADRILYLKGILNALPVKDRFNAAINEPMIAGNIEQLKVLLSCLPENQRIEAIYSNKVEAKFRKDLLLYAIRLQKRYCNDPDIRTKFDDEILFLINSAPELKKRPEVSLQILKATHELLADPKTSNDYKKLAFVVKSYPNQAMQILGNVMIALGLLVAIVAVATLITAPILPVALPVAVSSGAVGAGLASVSIFKGLGIFNKKSDSCTKLAHKMEELTKSGNVEVDVKEAGILTF